MPSDEADARARCSLRFVFEDGDPTELRCATCGETGQTPYQVRGACDR